MKSYWLINLPAIVAVDMTSEVILLRAGVSTIARFDVDDDDIADVILDTSVNLLSVFIETTPNSLQIPRNLIIS